MYGFRKNVLINKQHYKNQHKKPTTMLVMLLRMLYLHSNKTNASKFALQRILKILSVKMISSACLFAIRPSSTIPRAPVFSHNQCIIRQFTNLLFRRRFIHCAMVFHFISYCLAFFLKKVRSCSQKVRTHKKHFVSIGFQLHINNSEGACYKDAC